jgi:hypothetical protein
MNVTSPSRAIALFGTEEARAEVHPLRAGNLSAEFEAGKLRYIRVDGHEAIRGIAFVVRGPGWETFHPAISNLAIEQGTDEFRVSYDGEIDVFAGALSFHAEIRGSAADGLEFKVDARAGRDFETNRTGFVVLHAVEGVAGQPCTILHVDGSEEATVVPDLVMPLQPFFDMRAISHEAAPGLRVTCCMEGEDAWECEDQRNWTDASYKTYYRPLALPFPYTIAGGSAVEQSVTVRVEGAADGAGAAADASDDSISVSLGAPTGGAMPRIGIGIPAGLGRKSLAALGLLHEIGPLLLIAEYRSGMAREDLASCQQLADALDAELTVEIVAPCERPLDQEMADAAADIAAAGVRPDSLLVAQARLMDFTLETLEALGVPSFAELYGAARAAFPGVSLGGGVLTNFTEMNRNHPSPEQFDFMSHITSAVVHEVDDRSVMETLQSLPSIIASVRAMAGGKPYRVGPSAIGMRYNPYGPSTYDNKNNVRMAFNQQDPRHRALTGAAFTLGYVARMATGGVEAVSLGAAVGEFGLAYRKMDHPQPWYDDLAAPGDGREIVFPLCHIVAAMAGATGARLLAAESAAPDRLLCLAYETPTGCLLWLANLTPEPQTARVSGLPAGETRIGRLDEGNFVRAVTDPQAFAADCGPAGNAAALALAPYAVARIEVRA